MRSKSGWAWTAIAMWTLMAHFSGGSWPALIVLATICYGVMKMMPENTEDIAKSKLYCFMQLIAVFLLLTQLLPLSAQYWPGKYADKIIPSVLLILGAYSVMKRPERIAGILFWAMAILLIPLGLAGGRDLRLEWIAPSHFGVSVWMVPTMFIPILMRFAAGKGNDLKWYKRIVLVGIIMWIAISGVLSHPVAAILETPFREAGMVLSMGAYSRFESIVSVTLTIGWYGLSSMLFLAVYRCIEGLNIKKALGIVIFTILVLTSVIKGVRISPAITVIYIIFVWILFPNFDLKKRSKKSEKST